MEKRKTTPSFYTALFFALLFVVLMIFSGFFDAFHLSLGLISCAIVTWISSDLLFEDRTTSFRRRLIQFVRMVSYTFWLLRQIVLANVFLLRLAFGPRERLQPQIVRY